MCLWFMRVVVASAGRHRRGALVILLRCTGAARYCIVRMMPRIFIAGCGFVGLATARRFHEQGWEVLAATHSDSSAEQLSSESFRVVACDIAEYAAVEKLRELGGFDVVLHCASSGRGGVDAYRRVYQTGAANLSQALEPGLLIFTSSTSVYAQTGGEWVTEESAADPLRDTGQTLRATEELVLARSGAVARLAGIYGPGRSVLLRKFFAGEAVIENDGTRWINQVHRDDIAAALAHLVEQNARGIFNVSDDTPMQQRAIYEWLASRFERPLPPNGPVDPHRKRGWTSKRVSNAKLRALGWQPRFPSFFDAVERDPALSQSS